MPNTMPVYKDPSADQTIQAYNLLPAAGNPSGQSLGSSAAAWNVVGGIGSFGQLNNRFVLDGVHFAQNNAGLQAALTAANASGGVVEIPSDVTITATEQIVLGAAGPSPKPPVFLKLGARSQLLLHYSTPNDAMIILYDSCGIYGETPLVAAYAGQTITGSWGLIEVGDPYYTGFGGVIDKWQIAGNVVTFTLSNSYLFSAGEQLTLNNFTTGSFFNGQTVTVLSQGLSSSQFEANFTHADQGPVTDAGYASPVFCTDVIKNQTDAGVTAGWSMRDVHIRGSQAASISRSVVCMANSLSGSYISNVSIEYFGNGINNQCCGLLIDGCDVVTLSNIVINALNQPLAFPLWIYKSTIVQMFAMDMEHPGPGLACCKIDTCGPGINLMASYMEGNLNVDEVTGKYECQGVYIHDSIGVTICGLSSYSAGGGNCILIDQSTAFSSGIRIIGLHAGYQWDVVIANQISGGTVNQTPIDQTLGLNYSYCCSTYQDCEAVTVMATNATPCHTSQTDPPSAPPSQP